MCVCVGWLGVCGGVIYFVGLFVALFVVVFSLLCLFIFVLNLYAANK